MEVAANKIVVRDFISAFARGDLDGARRCLAPDAFAVSKGTSRLCGVRSYEAILGTIAALKKLVPKGFEPKIHSIIGEGDAVTIEFEGQAELMNGEDYNNQYCMVFTLKDGKIVRLHEYCCTLLTEQRLAPLLGAL